MNGENPDSGLWLRDQFVFLSASKPSRNPERFPLVADRMNGTSVEIEEAVVSLARAVFSRGGRLVFGGHPSISPLVASVAAEYFPAGEIEDGMEPVWIFQSRAFEKVIPKTTTRLKDLGYARIFWTESVDEEQFQPKDAGQEQCLNSLRAMRQAMIDLCPPGENSKLAPNRKPIAMVAIGGMEGVVREARLFLEQTAGGVYALRSTAGAASRLFEYLKENFPAEPAEISAYRWDRRISYLEEIFPFKAQPRREIDRDLPLASYAILMQMLVMRIAQRDLSSPGNFPA
jgi:hypothetical protein